MVAPVLCGKVAKHAVWKAVRKWKAKGWRVMFDGEGYDEYRFSGMMWPENDWIFSDVKKKLTWMANDIIEELMNLDMEPKAESLWWKSTKLKLGRH